jgi:hypothetical protein
MSDGDLAEVLGDSYNPYEHEAAAGFDPIDPAWYPLEITGANVKDTKAGDGKVMPMELTVLDGKFAGRKIFHRINLANPSAKCVEIGMRELAAIGQALGLQALRDTAELIGGKFLGKVTVRKDEGRDPDNEIKGWKPLDGATQPEQSATSPAKKDPKVTAKSDPKAEVKKPTPKKRPWEK